MESNENDLKDGQLPPSDPPPPPPPEDPPPPAPEGATVYVPKGMTSFNWQGRSFDVDEEGAALVPHEAVQHLLPHGISTSPIPDPTSGKKKGK
ncbi:MAG: hypothetical protein ACTHMK_13715 [Dyella sp.]|uniref:hypothetical protein n=1 Tax=Dyella sp. TaxID=1869338 RepID=UPI003F808888